MSKLCSSIFAFRASLGGQMGYWNGISLSLGFLVLGVTPETAALRWCVLDLLLLLRLISFEMN